jgi:hypothetical protein
MERLDRTHAEPLVGPEHVAEPENDRREPLPHSRSSCYT